MNDGIGWFFVIMAILLTVCLGTLVYYDYDNIIKMKWVAEFRSTLGIAAIPNAKIVGEESSSG